MSNDKRVEFDESRLDDKEYMISYYESRIKVWEELPNNKKVIEHYRKQLAALQIDKSPKH